MLELYSYNSLKGGLNYAKRNYYGDEAVSPRIRCTH